jgi:hypothetical protein
MWSKAVVGLVQISTLYIADLGQQETFAAQGKWPPSKIWFWKIRFGRLHNYLAGNFEITYISKLVSVSQYGYSTIHNFVL